MVGDSMYRNDGIYEKSILVRCKRDPAEPERTCFARVLQQGGKVIGISGNGCEDYDGSAACATCIKETQKMVQMGEA